MRGIQPRCIELECDFVILARWQETWMTQKRRHESKLIIAHINGTTSFGMKIWIKKVARNRKGAAFS